MGQELSFHLVSQAANPRGAQFLAHRLHAALLARLGFRVVLLRLFNRSLQLLRSLWVPQFQQYLFLIQLLLSTLQHRLLIRLLHPCPRSRPARCNAYGMRHSSAHPTVGRAAVSQVFLHIRERKLKWRDQKASSRFQRKGVLVRRRKNRHPHTFDGE